MTSGTRSYICITPKESCLHILILNPPPNGEHVTTPAELREYCIIVGTPITSYGNTPFVGDRIQGAVFLVKPISEISAAVNALITALVVSMLAVAALMIIPAYFASKSITGPVNRMTDVAQAIALGDFKVNAPERGRGEPTSWRGQLKTLLLKETDYALS